MADESSVPDKDYHQVNLQNPLDEHTLAVEDVALRYGTILNSADTSKSQGLPSSIAQQRIASSQNVMTPKLRENPIRKIGNILFTGFNVLMAICFILTLVIFILDTTQISNLYLLCALAIVIILNTTIEYFMILKSEKAMDAIKSLVSPEVTVIRDSDKIVIDTKNLVVGDLVCLKMGDKVAADMRVIHSNSLMVDNSSITGENERKERRTDTEECPPLRAHNLMFNGTIVVAGRGMAIVVRTGDDTFLGQIAQMTVGAAARKSQISKEMELFVRKLVAIAIVSTIIFLIIGISQRMPAILLAGSVISVFIAYVPQGLPVTVTTMLTIAASRMAKLNVVVKGLGAVETLGAITLLATDKTGTLTQNKMTMVGVSLVNTVYSLPEIAEDVLEEPPIDNDHPCAAVLYRAAALCSNAAEEGTREEACVTGDATEVGIYLAIEQLYRKPELIREETPRVHEIPFDSSTKHHVSVHRENHSNGHFMLYIKGAPERIARMCTTLLVPIEEGGTTEIEWTGETQERFDDTYMRFARHGQRVIAFARKPLNGQDYPEDVQFKSLDLVGLTFIGLVSLMDPPKRWVKKAVAALRTAGVQVVMVTGDHPVTAEAIARKIGLVSGDTEEAARAAGRDEYEAVVVDGTNIEVFTEEDWDHVLSHKEVVFARTSPADKLAIVTRFQAKGHIVGVSGDGVNDSPALKKADMGISMNKTASDVSKEVASIILMDDNFATIVVGVKEGRLIFENLKKAVRYVLCHIIPELMPTIYLMVLGMPVMLTSMLILSIDLGTELAPTISFAYEVAEGDLMVMPPRKVCCTAGGKRVNYTLEVAQGGNMIEKSAKMEELEPAGGAEQEQQQDEKGQTIEVETKADVDVNLAGEEGKAKMETVVEVDKQPAKRSLVERAMERVRVYYLGKTTGEMLVDRDLLMWSYLQSGIFEASACFGAFLVSMAWAGVPIGLLFFSNKKYFIPNAENMVSTNNRRIDSDMQEQILIRAQSGYFLSVVLFQSIVLWTCKHYYSYPWGMDYLQNWRMVPAVLFSYLFALFIVFTPGIQRVFMSYNPYMICLTVPLGAGMIFYAYEVVRRYLKKRGWFGGFPKRNPNLLELVRTTSIA